MTRSPNSEVRDPSSSRQAGEPIVSFDGIHKIYGDDSEGDERVVALQDINAEVQDGEFVSIVGPSGCGKSTLLHMTSGLLPPTKGNVYINGIDSQSPDHKYHDVGLVFQKPVLLDWRTVRKNVLLPVQIMHQNDVLEHDMDHYRSKVDELLELVGLDGFEDSYPQELSGGMQQRVSICRSLVYDPQVLLMDEPFGALDALTRDKMNEELLRIWSETDKTILFVTHNLEEAVFLSDKVFVLSPRPGQLLDVIDVDLPRPRNDETRRNDRYQEIVSETYSYFRGKDSE